MNVLCIFKCIIHLLKLVQSESKNVFLTISSSRDTDYNKYTDDANISQET